MANILWCYIHYFTTHPEGDKAKYYYDEYSDRSDSYRKALVEKIAQMASTSYDFTNKVLSYMYWGIKRDKLKPYILKPRQADKFKDADYWYSGAFGGIIKFTRALCDAMAKVLEKIGYLLTVLIDAAGNLIEGAGNTAEQVGNILKYLPWILGDGVAVFAGVQVWSIKKRGKLMLPPVGALKAIA